MIFVYIESPTGSQCSFLPIFKIHIMSFRILLFTLLFFSIQQQVKAQEIQTENVFLITFDGLRWQELFGGADSMLIADIDFVKDTTELKKLFWRTTKEERRETLFPFIWNTIAQEGQIHGNRWYDNKVNCTNVFWFSYPGYNEILTGYSDPDIRTNNKIYNPNETILEFTNNKKQFKGKVAAFGSWDVFPYIINDKRSGIPVNAGFRSAEHDNLSHVEQLLNRLQPTIPSPWATVRLDAFTHNYALEHIKKEQPNLVYISYGETDDFAHDGRYDHYLKSAHQTDAWIKELWDFVQSHPQYKDKTTFIITTDHGRGAYPNPKGEWKSHGKTYDGSNAIWLMAIGPDTPVLGEVKRSAQLWQNQVAQTVAILLSLNYKGDRYECGKYVKSIVKK